VRLVSAEPPSAERAWILAGYAQLLFLLHRYADSRRVAEEGLTAARQAKARREEGRALACLGGALVALGDYGGFTLLRDAWRIAEEQADVDGLGWACNVLASSNEWAGRLKEALAATLEGAEASRRLGAPAWHDTLLSFAAISNSFSAAGKRPTVTCAPSWSTTGPAYPRACTRGGTWPGSTSPAATSPRPATGSTRREAWPRPPVLPSSTPSSPPHSPSPRRN
jgi:hypothetical protein